MARAAVKSGGTGVKVKAGMWSRGIQAVFVATFVTAPYARAGGGPGSAFGEGLRLTNTAWALGMSEAMVASGAGVSAISLNPAGVLDSSMTTLHLTHTFFVADIAEDYLAFSQRMPYGSAVGMSVHGLYDSSSPVTLEDADGNYAGDAGGYPIGFVVGGLAYAIDVSRFLGRFESLHLTGGVGIRAVWQRIEKREWLGASLDLGLKVRPGAGFIIGGVVQNVGIVSGESHLPLQWVGGIAWEARRILGNGDRFLIEVDSPVAVDRDLSLRIGSEYRIRFGHVVFAMRGGWKQDMEVLDSPGITGGFGFRWMMGLTPWGMDYAFVPWGVLGNMHSVALTVGLVPKPEDDTPVKKTPKELRPPFVFYPMRGETARYTMTVTESSWLSAVLLDNSGNVIMTLMPRQFVQPADIVISWDGLLPSGRVADFERVYRIRFQLGERTWYGEVMPRRVRE